MKRLMESLRTSVAGGDGVSLLGFFSFFFLMGDGILVSIVVVVVVVVKASV